MNEAEIKELYNDLKSICGLDAEIKLEKILKSLYWEDLDTEMAAALCHEMNKTYCESIGDYSQPTWEDAPDWQKDSALQGVKFAIENNFPSPAEMHENWSKQKYADGWVYGEKKDPEAKTHHCLVPYDELPESQKVKDLLFSLVAKTLYTVAIRERSKE